MRFLLVTGVLFLLIAGCGLDPTLTCGSACADGASGADGSSSDSSNHDVSQGQDGSMCGQQGATCSIGSDCCTNICVTTMDGAGPKRCSDS